MTLQDKRKALGGATSVAVRPDAPVTLRTFDELDDADHRWARAKLIEQARVPMLPFFFGGIAGSVLFLSRVVPMEFALGVFVGIPALGLIYMLRQRRAFIEDAAERGIDAGAARRLLSNATPTPR